MPDKPDSPIATQPSTPDPSTEQGRMPPQALEIEEAVLGAMLIEHEAATIALQMLRPGDFYKPAHRHIFETLYELYERDNPLDLLTVENELRDKSLLDQIGGTSYLSDLTRSVSSAANIDYHAQIIAEKAVKRHLILNCSQIIKNAYDTTSDAYDVLDEAEQRIFDLSNTQSRANAQAIGDVLKDTLQHLEEIRGKPSGITGVPTGLDIDKLTSGFQPGDLAIVAARPSMGKTAFVLTAARNAALHMDENLQTNVALFSLEMSNQSLVQRLLTMEGRIDAQSARTGRLKDEDFKRLIDAASRLFTARIFIDDTPSISVMELRTKCRRLKSEHNIGLVIVDYLQLMTASVRDNQNREQEIATISRGLKALAKELNVPVVALSQLSRAVEQRGGDKRPQLSDLRESGCLTGDSLVTLAETGTRIPIDQLVNSSGFKVLALNQKTKKLEPATVTNAFCTGRKPVFLLETRLGRKIRATANHKFLTITGWKRLDQMVPGDPIALPRSLPTTVTQTIPDPELARLAHLIGDGCALPRHTGMFHEKMNMAYSGAAISKKNVSRSRAQKVSEILNLTELSHLAGSDIYWDRIAAIQSEGEELVYDLTVAEHHNFIANNIIVHNSIEQDADVVMFLYRPEYYGIKTTAEGHSTKGLAEIIVGKQRNGPTGSKRLFFVENYARFENFTQADGFSGSDGISSSHADLGSQADSPPPPPPAFSPGGDDDEAPF